MADAHEPDYYAILDVPDTASGPEIARAYRRLVRRLHPDANRGADPRELQDAIDAYQVIGDPARRSAYDASRSSRSSRQRRSAEAVGGTRIPVHHVPGPAPRDVPGTGGAPTPASRPPVSVGDVILTPDEAGRGATAVVEVEEQRLCPSCRGRGEHPTDHAACPTCHGTGLTIRRSNRITIRQECPSCQGRGRLPRPCPRCDGAGVTSSSTSVRVKIPAGVKDGTRIRLPGPADSRALYATVRLRPRAG